MEINTINEENREAATAILKREWGLPIVSRGKAHDGAKLPGFVALSGGKIAGLVTYNIDERGCEITSLNSFEENKGVGTALINAVLKVAESNDCGRLWLITTNDIIQAIRFYQRRGFEWIATHINSAEIMRQLKPSIPLIGEEGIPIKHEIEFEMKLK
ncbi:MAG: GNAT family N-acetyltransferase [Oscillospiraceae bacterium]|jgi:ribosomal protein S18 acetylase RimI-like enzyme|nr:GNAT family N-acetyltransferase [Oscillospiraceae bacterium]